MIILAYLNNKMFKIKIYKHQILSISLVFIPFILKSVTMILLCCDENNHLKDGIINYKYGNTDLFKSLFVAHAWLFPISFILYFFIMTTNSYILLNIKKIIDLKYVSITKLFILYGIFGIIFTSLIALILTFLCCGKKNDYSIYDIYDYICKVVDDKGNRFIDSYSVYFNRDFKYDLIKTIIGSVGIFLNVLFLFEIIQNLNI